MSEPIDVLPKVCSIVIGDWAMGFADPAPSEVGIFPDDSPFFVASLEFTTDYDPSGRNIKGGKITIVSQKSFATLIARNLLGLDEDEHVAEIDCYDALREMANVAAGHFVSEYFGEDAVVPLHAPSVVPSGSREEISKILSSQTQCYLCDGQPVAVHVELE